MFGRLTVLVVGVFLLGAVACAGGGETVAQSPQSPVAPGSAAAAAPSADPAAPTAPQAMAEASTGTAGETMAKAEGPKYGGVFRTAMTRDFTDFDMSYSGKSGPNTDAEMLAYNTLTSFKVGPDVAYGEMTIEPELAESWEVSADGTTFTFNLRKGIKWADMAPLNGRAFTADDVKWGFEYLTRTGQFKGAGTDAAATAAAAKLSKTGRMAWMMQGIQSVEAPDANTAVVKFDVPFVPFLNYTATEGLLILPHDIYDVHGNLRDNIVGTGPFQLDVDGSQSGSKWVFKKNPNYWEAGKPYLDEVHRIVLPETATALAAFATEKIDIFSPSPGFVTNLQKSSPDAHVVKNINPAPFNLYMGQARPPLNDIRLRRAISLALDRDEFVRVLSGGEGGWAMAGAFPETFSQAEIKKILRYDPAEARRLVAEAGYKDGLDIAFLIRGKPSETLATEAQLLQDQLKKANINVRLHITPDKPAGRKLMYSGNFELLGVGKALYGDVDSYLTATYYSKSGTNFQLLNDPKLDALIDAQRAEIDPVKRLKIVRDAGRYLAETAQGLAVFRGVVYNAWQPYLKNYSPRWRLYDANATNLWLDK